METIKQVSKLVYDAMIICSYYGAIGFMALILSHLE